MKPCSCDHLYSETTSIQGPLGRVPIVALQCIFTSNKETTSIQRPLFFGLAWSLNKGFTVDISTNSKAIGIGVEGVQIDLGFGLKGLIHIIRG